MNTTETSRVKLVIDGDEGEQTLKALQTEAKEITAELRRMRQAGEEGSDAWKELKNRQAEVNAELKSFTANIDLNDASMNELRARSAQLNRELKDLKVGSEEWISKMKEVADVDHRIGEVRDEMNELRDANDENSLSWKRVKEAAIGAFAAFSLEDIIQEVISFGKESVKSAAEMSDAMSDIEKATDMTSQEVEGLVENIKKIDTRTAVEDLNDIAVVAGQLGIAKNEVLGFVESVDRAVVALGDEFTGGAEEVASTIGALQKLFKETKDLEAGKAINDIGSALNALGAAGSATAPVVADFATRMGQLGDLSPQISQTLGLGAAFQEMGLTAEIGASGLSNILGNAAKDTAGFARQIGITEVEFKKMINSSPNDVILKLAASLKGMPVEVVTQQMASLGIRSDEARKVMSLLKDQTELVTNRQKLAADEMKKGTSLWEEFTKKNTNAAAELAKMGKEVKNITLSFGQALLPVVLKVGQALIAFVTTIASIPKFLNDNKAALAMLTIGLVTFNAELIVSATSSLALAAAEKGRAIATSAMTAAQWLLNAAMSANPITAVIAGITALIGGLTLLYNNSQTVRAGIAGLWNAFQVGIDILKDFWTALSKMNFAEAANLWASGGTKVAQAFGDGYKNKIKTEQAAIEADHKAHVDKKADASKAGADTAAGHQKTANQGALNAMAADNSTHQTKEEKKAADHAKKVADDKRKANQDALNAIEKASIDAIANEEARKLAQLKFDRDQEVIRVNESVASANLKKQQIEVINQAYETKKAATEKDFRDKKEKEEADLEQKLETMRIAAITSDSQRKIAELKAQAAREREEIEKSKMDAAQKGEALKLINDKLNRDVATANEEARQDDLKKNQEKREKEKASNDALFNSQYQAAIANADLNLELAKNNSSAILAAKQDKLKAEYEYNRKKLQDEAAEEKLKNQELITDADARAAAEKNIDDRLRSQLKAADIQFQNEKTALNQEHLERRQQNTQAFFGALNGLMQGDYSAFMGFLNDKLKNDAAANNQKLQDFSQKGQETLAVASQVIDTMKAANQKYLESQLAKIEKEKQTQIKSWDAQYKAGTISKEEYEEKIAEINTEADERVKEEKLKAFKREQTLNIASALVNAAQAALKSMAMMGFPLGLIGVGAAAAMAAIQIGIIKSQKPPSYAKGGTSYVKNAGVVRGSRHGSEYGKAGISMVDRVSGQEVGEMEGDEPFMILSRDTYKNNGGIIDMLLHSSLHRNGARIFANGGVGTIPETPYSQKGSYLFGSKKAKKAAAEAEAQAAAAQAEAEEMQRQAEADANAAMAGYGGVPADGVYVPGSEGDPSGYVGSTNEQIAASQEMMAAIADNTEATVDSLNQILDVLNATQVNAKAQTGFLGIIASKDLSVSVHNVVNVMNQINVVSNDSNLK